VTKKKQKWQAGDVFTIQLADKRYAIGQVLDLMMPNVVRCALYGVAYAAVDEQALRKDVCRDNLISLVATTREQLDFHVWRVVGNCDVFVSRQEFPNEATRSNGWVGSVTYDAAILEDFLNAFHGLVYWDDWADPKFLDELLVDVSLKPKSLLHKKR